MEILTWALWFFIIAVVNGVIGFTGILLPISGICKVLFFIFLVLTLVALIAAGGNKGVDFDFDGGGD